MAHEGGCLCGATRFKARGEPLNVRVCHCRLCQLAYGQPFNARAFFEADRVSIEGPVESYPSSDNIERLFCGRCGARFASRRKNGTGIGLALTLFDERDSFEPECHIWVAEKVGWLKLDDGLPQYPGALPA